MAKKRYRGNVCSVTTIKSMEREFGKNSRIVRDLKKRCHIKTRR